MKKLIILIILSPFSIIWAQNDGSHVLRLQRTTTTYEIENPRQSGSYYTYNQPIQRRNDYNVERNAYQRGFTDARHDNYLREANRTANRVALLSFGSALLQSRWRDGRFINPVIWQPSRVRYRPQDFFYYPTYHEPTGSFLNQFDRARYLNNWNGGYPIYRRPGRQFLGNNGFLIGNPPLNWGF
ncbi:MAG: hypothetical protein MRY57_01665 [Candidatus Pacebacteria bacterium]|nr:hypothetical protein [Candidatus Paceibacterota bacterium]